MNCPGIGGFGVDCPPFHRADFLAHNIDVVFTTSNVMEDIAGVERHRVFQEPYVMIFPKDYDGGHGASYRDKR